MKGVISLIAILYEDKNGLQRKSGYVLGTGVAPALPWAMEKVQRYPGFIEIHDHILETEGNDMDKKYADQAPDHWDRPESAKRLTIKITGEGNRWEIHESLERILNLLEQDDVDNRRFEDGFVGGDGRLDFDFRKAED